VSIRTKAHSKLWRKGSVGVSSDCPKLFKYPLLFQERVKLRTSNLKFGPYLHSQRPSEQKPIKNFGEKSSVGVTRGCPKFLSTRYYLWNG